MTTAIVESTRVFVSGLPPSLTSDQLASHFRKQYKVTDAHVFTDRRIGFVGFHDHDTAQNAVKYFNRSYIRMSKISVDLAKPVEVKRDANRQAVPVSFRGSNKRDRSDARVADAITTDSRKRKRETKDDGEGDRAQSADQVQEQDKEQIPQEIRQEETQNTSPQLQDKPADAVQSQVLADSDWLRGKTSRLLDLVEPGEVMQRADEVTPAADQSQKPEIATSSADIQEEVGDGADSTIVQSVPNARLFIRNLAFDIVQEELQSAFEKFGRIQEIHISRDARTNTSKGMAFVQFGESTAAEDALQSMDGVAFHGRLLHILPASNKRDQGLTEFEISKMPLKKQKAVRRKLEAATATFSWNSMYMNPDAVVSSIADRLGVSKAQILDPTSADAAVKQAHAETQIIAETKEYLRSRGIVVDAFKNRSRDDRTLLLKNFPFGTNEEDLRVLLEPFGQITRFVMPPAGTMAVSQFAEPYSASQALKGLAYKNIKGSVLYLERAPQGLLPETSTLEDSAKASSQPNVVQQASEITKSPGLPCTVFVRNLNFSTTTTVLRERFSPLSGFLSARVKTRTDPKRPGEILSNGFGFVEFASRSQAEAAIEAMNNYRLEGHNLILKISTKDTDMAEERRKTDLAKKSDANKTRIIIKNLPFQASRKDVKALFSQYGQLKTVRVPKKFDNSSRGFGFAEFVTAKEAQNAMEALSDTHLLGRRLVLDFVAEESVDAEEEIRAIEKKMEQQSNRINLSKMAGPGRKKFNVGTGEDEEG